MAKYNHFSVRFTEHLTIEGREKLKKVLLVVFMILLLVTICHTQTGHLNDAYAEDFLTISIALSPDTIVLSNKATGYCGIHTNIGYGAVDTSTLELSGNPELEGIPVDVAKSDSHGNLIVMVSLKKVKTLVSVPSTTLTLSGYTNGQEPILFFGSDIVRVKD